MNANSNQKSTFCHRQNVDQEQKAYENLVFSVRNTTNNRMPNRDIQPESEDSTTNTPLCNREIQIPSEDTLVFRELYFKLSDVMPEVLFYSNFKTLLALRLVSKTMKQYCKSIMKRDVNVIKDKGRAAFNFAQLYPMIDPLIAHKYKFINAYGIQIILTIENQKEADELKQLLIASSEHTFVHKIRRLEGCIDSKLKYLHFFGQ